MCTVGSGSPGGDGTCCGLIIWFLPTDASLTVQQMVGVGLGSVAFVTILAFLSFSAVWWLVDSAWEDRVDDAQMFCRLLRPVRHVAPTLSPCVGSKLSPSAWPHPWVQDGHLCGILKLESCLCVSCFLGQLCIHELETHVQCNTTGHRRHESAPGVVGRGASVSSCN